MRKATGKDGAEPQCKLSVEFQLERRVGKESQAEGTAGSEVWLTQPVLSEATAALAGHLQDTWG